MAFLCSDDFPVNIGDLLFSPTSKYLVQTFAGEGAFGKVATCLELCRLEPVAIKILKSKTTEEATEEVDYFAVVDI